MASHRRKRAIPKSGGELSSGDLDKVTGGDTSLTAVDVCILPTVPAPVPTPYPNVASTSPKVEIK